MERGEGMSGKVTEFFVGKHRVELREPDVGYLEWHGLVTPDEFRELVEEVATRCASWPWMLIMVDQSDLEAIPPESRKVAPELSARLPLRGIVVWGGSPVIRAIAMLIMKMINLLRRGDNPIASVADAASAQVWIEKRRLVLLADPEERKHA
jgi:hypothetical protein